MKKIYRSQELLPGALNKVGTAHIHIDGAKSVSLVIKILKILEKKGNPGKLSVVHDFIAGNQRELLPETYESHTPAIDGEEAYDFFSSTLVKDRNDAIGIINMVCKMLSHVPGVVVEMEQVCGWYENNKWQWLQKSDWIKKIKPKEIAFPPSPSLPFEIHHGFNIAIDKKGPPPISLDELMDFCRRNNIIVGGWFIFEKERLWAYRSNSFTYEKGLHGLVEREQKLLDNFLKQQGANPG